MVTLKGRIIALIILLSYVALVCYMCLANFNDSNMASWLPTELLGIKIDKCIHFCLFFPVPVLFFITFHGSSVMNSALFTLVCCVAAGTAIEYSQKLTAYRTFDVYDLYANYLAIFCGTIIISLVFTIRYIYLFTQKKTTKHRK